MKDNRVHGKSFDDMDKAELSDWLIRNIDSLSSYQLKLLCKRAKEMNDIWLLAEKMISIELKRKN